MKKIYILITAILLTVSANAQAPDQMTYQAVVRDASNNLVSNTAVGIQISILKESENGEVVYVETQQPTTNTNGLISIVIGTPPNTDLEPGLSQVDWENDSYFIKTEIDPTGGTNYTIIGTTQLLSVPYALYAKNSGDKVFSTTNNVTSNANGDIANDDFVFGSKQLNGTETRMFFDKSKGAFRVGKVNGTEWDEVNVGQYSFASGELTEASGDYSTAMGWDAKAFGEFSTVIGIANYVNGDYATAIGTQSYAEGNLSMVFGHSSTVSGTQSIAIGSSNFSGGLISMAIGVNNNAEGDYSLAIGQGSKSIGESSIALGSDNIANGFSSLAMGIGSITTGYYSTTMGVSTTAETYVQTSIGFYNTGVAGAVDSFIPTDRLFVIGNGTSSSNKSDAMVILKNGNTTINGNLDVNEINATDSGNADMKTYMYGLVRNTGTIDTASSDGFTITKTGTGAYTINFNNSPGGFDKYIVVASLYGSNGIGFIRMERQSSSITINTYNTSGTLADKYFSFIVYKK